jgi:serine/threonine-protein kinase RsbW
MEERRFPRALGSLDALFGFLSDFAERHTVGEDAAFDLRVAIEELFVNMVRYHPESEAAILLRLERDGPWVRVTLQDFDVDSWDITKQAPKVDVNAPAEARRAGGLGLHLVRRLTDDVRYEYRDRSSTITLTKRVAR